ncbi:MAG TPA: hypothetical protein VK590_05765 [Saprospiraceae bacterium]|nr:hypothetical protein [Saprospiraceae bacterium]
MPNEKNGKGKVVKSTSSGKNEKSSSTNSTKNQSNPNRTEPYDPQKKTPTMNH